jgi:hypothetical protein
VSTYICNEGEKTQHQPKLHIDEVSIIKPDLYSAIGHWNIILCQSWGEISVRFITDDARKF